MIVLLTGKPGVGKSTLVQSVITRYDKPMAWTVTREIRNNEGERVGFMAVNDRGTSRVISHKTDIESPAVIGQNKVDLAAVDEMFAAALRSNRTDGAVVIIDEIGPIQMLSPKFNETLQSVFASPVGINMLATIHYKDEQLGAYRTAADTWMIEVTEGNRDLLASVIPVCLSHLKDIDQLSSRQKACVLVLLKSYIDDTQPLQIQKLLRNAICYVHNAQVVQTSEDTWSVKGNHGEYQVQLLDNRLSCVCDLYMGRGKYIGTPGDCSHIQAVKIIEH